MEIWANYLWIVPIWAKISQKLYKIFQKFSFFTRGNERVKEWTVVC